jgi:hypothetical protein
VVKFWIYLAAVILTTGCGRINYDPLGGGEGDGTFDPQGAGPDASVIDPEEAFACAPSGGSSCPNVQQIWSAGITSFGGPMANRGDSSSGTCGQAGTPEITGHFTPLQAGRFQIDSTQSDFAHALYLLSGDCGGTELACSTDGVIEVDLAANETIVVVVDSMDSVCGSADVRMQKVN